MSSTGPTTGINGTGYTDYAGVFAGQNVEERGAGFSAILSEAITACEELPDSASDSSAGPGAIEEPQDAHAHIIRYKKYEYRSPPAAIDANPPEETDRPVESGQLEASDAALNDIPVQSYEYYENSASTNTQAPGADYSSMIAGALQDEIARMSAMAGAGYSAMPDGLMPMQSSGIEQMIISAASTGKVSDAQIALFMLSMMMQTNQDGDFSMLMQMMATMLTQVQGDTDALRNSVMSSGYDQSVLGAIDKNVFNHAGFGSPGSLRALTPLNGWVPTTPAVRSTEANRSPQLYRAIVDQFRVETTPRYQPRDGKSYCNIFVWDVTSAMGAEIPYRTDSQTGEPWPEDTGNAISMSAARMDAWLERFGETYGWREADAQTAQYYANQGKPAVTTAGSVGHVQVVVPSRDGGYDPQRGVTIAQAGGNLTSYTSIKRTYSDAVLREKVRYWVHE